MFIEGEIRPNRSTVFTKTLWCDFIKRRPELVPAQPRTGINPFTGEAVEFKPPEDAADVMFDGKIIGHVSLSMSEEARVNVAIEESNIPLVEEWALELGGKFYPDH